MGAGWIFGGFAVKFWEKRAGLGYFDPIAWFLGKEGGFGMF
jgi:hypothetical protein